MSLNIIIHDSKSDPLKQIEDKKKEVIRGAYKQECLHEEHAGRELGEGSFTKSQMKKIWENPAIDRILANERNISEE